MTKGAGRPPTSGSTSSAGSASSLIFRETASGCGPDPASVPSQRTARGLRTARRGEQLVILLVAPEGPAARTGLKAGDCIIVVDDTVVADMPLSDPIRWNTAPAGTPLRLTLADGTRHDLVLADYY